jgi:hypothetical protein
VVGLACLNEAESHASGSYVTSGASHAGRVEGDRPDQKTHPGPPGWGLGHEADNLIPVKNINC